MDFFNRDAAIEYLLRRTFPWSGATRTKKAAAYRAQLTSKPLPELIKLFDEELAKESQQAKLRADGEERTREFNLLAACSPDYEYWGKVDYWSIDEGVALILGRAPEKVTWPKIEAYTRISAFAAKFERIRNLAIRTAKLGQAQFGESNLASAFIRWAKTKDLDIPTKLEEQVTKHAGDIVDWRALVQQRDERIVDLQSRLTQLESAARRWPWGEYTTPLLEQLAEAVDRFWVEYQPGRPRTAPRSKDVTEMLIGRGVVKSVAESIAQIIRDPSVPTGPRG